MTIALSTSKGRYQSAMDNTDLHWYVSLTSITTTKLHVFIKMISPKCPEWQWWYCHSNMFLGDKKGILWERKGVLPYPEEECICLGLLSCIKVSSNHLHSYLFTWEIFPLLWRRNHLYLPGRWIIIFIFRDVISSADNFGIACHPNKLSSYPWPCFSKLLPIHIPHFLVKTALFPSLPKFGKCCSPPFRATACFLRHWCAWPWWPHILCR